MNPLQELAASGQSVWIDYIRRDLVSSGELERLVREDGVTGMTSNPSIFEKAFASSADYAAALARHAMGGACDPKALYEAVAIEDIRLAADVLRQVYDRTAGRDGFVSLEVSPDLAHDTQGTLEEARRLWRAVGRDNLMIKVPGTPEGIPAIRQLISEGINVNVTLLFAVDAYDRVVEAFTAGLEARAEAGGDIGHVASVASFFVSRIDNVVDKALAEKGAAAAEPTTKTKLAGMAGKAAIANARMAYQHYLQFFSRPRWQALAARGARTQRVLWASTSTKNPAYPDTLYVDELIGPDTVNTMPPATIDAFRAHGRVRASLQEAPEGAAKLLRGLESEGVSMRQVTDLLLVDGVKQFSDAFAKLLAVVRERLAGMVRLERPPVTWRVPASIAPDIEAALDDWDRRGNTRRLWARDATLWTGADEGKWLGWLSIVGDQVDHVADLEAMAAEVGGAGFTYALLLGMGGSSLCPDVLRLTFGHVQDHPELHVLDSTDPGQIAEVASRVDLAKTLVIVSSKSGTTLEPNILLEYFFDRVAQAVGADEAGRRFVAITDPGSALERVARERGFRHIAHGWPSIGGRYSALSAFGMVPAAIMGVHARRFLDATSRMAIACGPCGATRDNPGVVLGAVLGVLARHGRDKLTIVASPAIEALGAWLEQLVAESTGKGGKGIVPVDLEPLGQVRQYGTDRVFVYLRLDGAHDPDQDALVTGLEEAGHAVLRIPVDSIDSLGQEFFRWEIATAVAGALIGINPFDQPDVEASKIATRRLTDAYEASGVLPGETALFADGGVSAYADARNAAAIGSVTTLAGALKAHFSRLQEGDYAALLAYVPMTPAHQSLLQQARVIIRDRRRAATCLGFGPRFLHSTGQVYKGGPNTGVFLQVTCDDKADLAVPGHKYSFGVVKAAQARGDFEVLAERGRRALRVHLGPDVASGLRALVAALDEALGQPR